MPVNCNVFIHESDKAALDALKAIPGFTQFTKAFMSGWNEKLMYIDNMASNVRISEKQLPVYREMLFPICEKLGIDVPDLFLKLDVHPNAWTYGDTKPYIIITSGLLETVPQELIPTVLAHECGHIACHHVLYRTMGQILLNGAAGFMGGGLGNIALLPIKAAFAYWMRCSEFSADRAAMLCDGRADNVIEMCMRFAGFDKGIPFEMNVDAFMEQAEEYHKLTTDDKWNKTLATMMYSFNSHPINAVRAYECREWAGSEEFVKAMEYLEAYRNNTLDEIPLPFSLKQLVNRDYEEVCDELRSYGLTNIDSIRITDRSPFMRNGAIVSVTLNDRADIPEGEWVNIDSHICLTYYMPLTEEELSHQIRLPKAFSQYFGRDITEVENDFRETGFTNIVTEPLRDLTDPFDEKMRKVFLVTIDRNMKFEKGDPVSRDAQIRIIYHDLAEGE